VLHGLSAGSNSAELLGDLSYFNHTMQRAYIIWLDIARLRKLWDDEAGIFVFVQFCVGRPTFNAGPRPWCGIAGSLTALCAGSGGWMVKIGFDFCSVQIAIPQGHAPMNCSELQTVRSDLVL